MFFVSKFFLKLRLKRYLLVLLTLSGLMLPATVFSVNTDNNLQPNLFPSVGFQEGHFQKILTIAPDQDGKSFTTGSLDNTLVVWDFASGRELGVLKSHRQGIVAASMNKDHIISGAYDGSVRVWRKNGMEIAKLANDTNSIHSMDVSKDGRYALTGYLNGSLRLWDLKKKKLIKDVKPHSGRVHWVCFSPDGKLALSCSYDETFIVWKTQGLVPVAKLSGRIRCAAFCNESKNILCGDADNQIRLLNFKEAMVRKTFKGHQEKILELAFSHDGNNIMSVSIDGEIKVWDIQGEREIICFSDKTAPLTAAKFLPEKNLVFLATGDSDPKITAWDLRTQKQIRTFERAILPSSNISVSIDGKLALSGGLTDGSLNLWDIQHGKLSESVKAHENGTFVVSMTTDGTKALSGGNDRRPKLWALNPLKIENTLDEGRSSVTSVCSGSDGRYVAAGFADGSMYIWDTHSDKLILNSNAHTKMVSKLFSHPVKNMFYSSSIDGFIKRWSAENDKEMSDIIKLETPILAMSLTENGENLIYCTTDPIIRSYQPNNGSYNLISGHRKGVTAFAIDAKETRLISADKLGTIRCFDMKSNKVLHEFQKTGKIIRSIAFYPDDKRAVSVNSDGLMTIWDVDKGVKIGTFASFNDGEWVFLTPQGFFSASTQGAMHLNLNYNHCFTDIKDYEKLLKRPDLVAAHLNGLKGEEIELEHQNTMKKIMATFR